MPTLTPNQTTAAVQFNNTHALDVLDDFCAVLNIDPRTEYDAATVELIAQKQKAALLGVDGKVGQRSRELLSALQSALPARVLWPAADASGTALTKHYLELCAKLGLETDLQRPLLIGLRGVELRGADTHPIRSVRQYDDAFVFLWSIDGKAMTREFAGATHPYQTQTNDPQTPDVDHDGERDVGTIKPGRLLMKPQEQRPVFHPALHIVNLNGKDGIPTWRDTNHDGIIAGAELETFLLAREVLLHPGFTSQKPDKLKAYSSIGCQTARVEDVQAVAEHPIMDYFLVHARTAIVTLESAPAAASGIS